MSNPTDDLASTVDRLRADYGNLVRRLESNQREFQRLARSVYRVQEDERRRLARELHDGLGQNLTALKHQLSLVADALGADRPELQAQLQNGIALCTLSLADTRPRCNGRRRYFEPSSSARLRTAGPRSTVNAVSRRETTTASRTAPARTARRGTRRRRRGGC